MFDSILLSLLSLAASFLQFDISGGQRVPVKSAEEAEELLAALLVPNSGYTSVRIMRMTCLCEMPSFTPSDSCEQ